VSESINQTIADCFDETARLLRDEGANPYRVDAYRLLAERLRRAPRPVTEILRIEGIEGLQHAFLIGEHLAHALQQIATTGRLSILERLRGENEPIRGSRARRHEPELDTTADATSHAPSVEEILEVDREYRRRGAAGELQKIAPERYNPRGEAWLPVLHTLRGGRHYTVLFSNTARAHRLGRTRDWVVIFFDDGSGERSCTVVTAWRGPLKGERVVRGREPECMTLRRRARRRAHAIELRLARGAHAGTPKEAPASSHIGESRTSVRSQSCDDEAPAQSNLFAGA
jgi:hypothetical protein